MSAIASLLACDWGRTIGLADDFAPCPQRAVQLVVLHDKGAVVFDGRLCADHFASAGRLTDPHRGGPTPNGDTT